MLIIRGTAESEKPFAFLLTETEKVQKLNNLGFVFMRSMKAQRSYAFCKYVNRALREKTSFSDSQYS